jgi:hypothetical protein
MLKRIKLMALVMYAIVLISVSLGFCQSAEEMIKNPSLKPKSSALKYVFHANDRISFTMYIHGDEITIIHSNTGHTETHKVVDKWTEADKLIMKLSNGALLKVDSDRVVWDKATYIRQNN